MKEYTTLYKLSFVEKEGEFAQGLSYSFDIEKLTSSVPCSSWTLMSDANQKSLVRKSQDNVFPLYLVNEVNLII